ncbi:MAG: penicillin-binding transpeptidase domain-containing protein [Candidatus Acidiferrales bacterium]
MRPSSSIRQAVPILCLVLAAAAGVAFGSPTGSPAAKRTHRTRTSSAYNHDPARFDATSYDDAIVRQVAIDALGHTNGSVVAMDPSNGRILTIVNQKMAFSSGFEPCSTIKPVIALAGLQEGAITRDTMLKVGRRRYMDLTEAMAHSNNVFFESVGKQLGFDTVIKYARLLGLGERVGYNITEEQPGALPLFPPKYGGVARMSSFGGGIRITPLQLASLAATLANGGTEYYLQYPRTTEDRVNFTPRVRRQLDIAPLLPDLREGMLAAVMYGTARRSYDPLGDQSLGPTLGKTGTCNDESLGGRLGWYVSYADEIHPKIVLVILIRGGGRSTNGPRASQIAGHIYRGLRERNYFAASAINDRATQYAAAGTAGASH